MQLDLNGKPKTKIEKLKDKRMILYKDMREKVERYHDRIRVTIKEYNKEVKIIDKEMQQCEKKTQK